MPVPTVKATFHNHDQAARALSALRSVFADRDLSMSAYPASRAADDEDDPVDPSASAALIGEAPVATMPAAGYNLVGNSATVDVRLGDLPHLLEAVADSEADSKRLNARRGGARISLSVHCHSPLEVESAKGILLRYGGERLRVND